MTDRYFALTVVLEREIRSDDCEPIIEAIKILRGVLDVKPLIADAEHYFNKAACMFELRKELWDVLNPSK